jgi:hypothetical protein
MPHNAEEMMANTKSLERLIDDYSQRMIRGDFTALDEFASDDWMTHANPKYILSAFHEVTCAKEGEKVFYSQVISAFPRVREIVFNKNVQIDAELVAINYTIRGIHDGTPFFDVPPSGEEEEINGTAIIRYEDDKMIEHWGGPTCSTCTGYVELKTVPTFA